MCLIIWVNKDMFVGEEKRINKSRFCYAVRRLVFKFVLRRETLPLLYREGTSV